MLKKAIKSPLTWIIIAIIVLWVFSGWATYKFAPEGNYGTFGDMFGSINALFSGLALAGVVFAIILQMEELKLQRKELELTRKELKRSAEAQEKSQQTFLEQLNIEKEKYSSHKKSIKPSFKWGFTRDSGSAENTLFKLIAEYDNNKCPKAEADLRKGDAEGFNTSFGQYGPDYNIIVAFRMDATKEITFRLRYMDIEHTEYIDLVTFKPSNPKKETIKIEHLEPQEYV